MRRSTLLAASAALALGCSGAAKPAADSAGNAALVVPSAPKTLVAHGAPRAQPVEPRPLLSSMQAELTRTLSELGKKTQAPPYYIAYEVIEDRTVGIEASLGGIVTSRDLSARSLDVDLRVGSPALDNTHPIRGDFDASGYFTRSAWLPIESAPAAVASVLWLTTHQEYERAVEDLVRVKANKAVKVDEEDQSADFSSEPALRYHAAPAALSVDRKAWETRLADLSALFEAEPEIEQSVLQFEATAETRYFVNSEGTSVQHPRTHARIVISASTTAEDGMELARMELADAHTPEGLPDDATLRTRIDLVRQDLKALKKAPLVEPYTGPAILDGRAAGVFFHEIFGHRIEGHRQKIEEEGQTFSRKVGQRIMPAFLDVYDDPTLYTLNGIDLSGHYLFDDEGVAAARANLVEDGVLREFLMSRSPIRGFDSSNGHGRRQRGYRVVSRQGNLVVDPSETTSPEGLKALLIAEVARQDKPFGLRFSEITGGYTNTSRAGAQAFKVLPVMVYKVYPDGREELVRGVDVEGTPLASLGQIMAAANDFQVFNGVCGAESGWVPVSAASPSLLVRQIEVARREKSSERPPLLPPPLQASKKRVSQ